MMTAAEKAAQILSRSEPQENGCLHWGGARNRDGYGNVRWQRRSYGAHRLAYELLVGPIAEGMTVDHTCHNADTSCPGGMACLHRRCVNVDHLEVVSTRQNTRRAYARRRAIRPGCVQGHVLDEANTYLNRGRRYCRTCARAHARKYRERLAMRAAGIPSMEAGR